jgi:hypothetical protein
MFCFDEESDLDSLSEYEINLFISPEYPPSSSGSASDFANDYE